jgi:hypothetical protein
MLIVIAYLSIYCPVNYGVMLLLVVASFMAGSTSGVFMFPVYGGYQVTAAKEQYNTSPPYYTTLTYATPRTINRLLNTTLPRL